jgi:hypothetical protein
LGKLIAISSHPNWKGKSVDVPKDDDPLVVKNLSKLDTIKGFLTPEDYLEFIEACVDVNVYNDAEDDIADMVDFFYDDKRIAL